MGTRCRPRCNLPLVNLHALDLGGEGNPPLIILHGLLGSSRNWRKAGADLAAYFHVLALDIRNHGLSPRSPEQTFEAMAGDVLASLDDRGLERVHLLGHSLGGKVAMLFACRHPERTRVLYVVDIAPKPYPTDRRAFDALLRLELRGLTSRAEAEARLARDIPDRSLRLFLLSNLARDAAGEFFWQANLPVLADALPALRQAPLGPGDRFLGRAVFIAGGRSDFVTEADRPAILERFPNAAFEVLAETGHYPHVEAREGFVRAVVRWRDPPVPQT
ncbi:MAG: alpha/beta fold hydrolase [Planctomycetota bacterium]